MPRCPYWHVAVLGGTVWQLDAEHRGNRRAIIIQLSLWERGEYADQLTSSPLTDRLSHQSSIVID